jgi:hypothetical protein
MAAAAAHARATGVKAPVARSKEEEEDRIIDAQIAAAKAKEAKPKKEAKKEKDPRPASKGKAPAKEENKLTIREQIKMQMPAARRQRKMMEDFRRRLRQFDVEDPEAWTPTPVKPFDKKAEEKRKHRAAMELARRASADALNRDMSLEEKLRRQAAREEEAFKFAEALALHEEYENMIEQSSRTPPIWNTLLQQEGGDELIQRYTTETDVRRKMSWTAATWPPLPGTAVPVPPPDPYKVRAQEAARKKREAEQKKKEEAARKKAEERARKAAEKQGSFLGSLSPIGRRSPKRERKQEPPS